MNDEQINLSATCGCGGKLRYSHFVDGNELMSCNKYVVCMDWDQQNNMINELIIENKKLKLAIEKIVNVNGMDYEYKSWAKEALVSTRTKGM